MKDSSTSGRYKLVKAKDWNQIDEDTVWYCPGPEMLDPPGTMHEVQGADRPEVVKDTAQERLIVVCYDCCIKKGLIW